MLSQIIQFIGLVNLPIKPDMCFFLVYDPLIFLIVFFISLLFNIGLVEK